MNDSVNVEPQQQAVHPRAISAALLLPIVAVSAAGALIGLDLIASLGITPNTSVIGAMAAMTLGRIPLAAFAGYRSPHAQNLVQSAMSSATFGAANSLLLPIGIPFLLGRADLIAPLFAGVAMAMIIDAIMLYRLYGTAIFPAEGAWPPGVAAAEVIRMGDSGRRAGRTLAIGGGVGLAGGVLGLPMLAFGVAFIGSVPALSAFCAGLLAKIPGGWLAAGGGAAWIQRLGVDPTLLPHGMMIGAALVALAQIAPHLNPDATGAVGAAASRRSGRTLMGGAAVFVAVAAFIAVAGGLAAELDPWMLAAFVVFAAVAALAHELVVGLAAMQSGWFPAYALALVTLMLGLLAGFPPLALALLTGFTAATGPCFADMGYDLKAGTILRAGCGPAFELEGRRQQLLATLVAFAVAIPITALAWPSLFGRGLIPPIDRVYAAAIDTGAHPQTLASLALWALPGAFVQWIGGARRQLGVMLATGLLLGDPGAGLAVLTGLALRLIWLKCRPSRQEASREASREALQAFGGGVICADAIVSVVQGMSIGVLRGR